MKEPTLFGKSWWAVFASDLCPRISLALQVLLSMIPDIQLAMIHPANLQAIHHLYGKWWFAEISHKNVLQYFIQSKPASLWILRYLSYWLRHYGWKGKGIQPSASDWLEKRHRIDRSQWKGCFALCAGHWIQSRYHFYYKDPLKAEDFKYTN